MAETCSCIHLASISTVMITALRSSLSHSVTQSVSVRLDDDHRGRRPTQSNCT